MTGDVALPPPSGTAYGNPRPYPTLELERHNLEGRITVQRTMQRRHEADGDKERAARAGKIVDELLDHLVHVEDRAASAALDKLLEA